MKLKEQLLQIEKRIAELRRKADWIKSQLNPTDFVSATIEVKPATLTDNPDIAPDVAECIKETEEALNKLPRRRGRKKLNEAE